MNIKSSKRGQITLFIIMGIIIVAGIVILFFFLNRSSDFTINTKKIDPEKYPQKCARDLVTESIEKILQGGGRITPEHTVLYNNEEYNYLCYQDLEFSPCVNHYPMIKSIVEEEIIQDTEKGVRGCFDTAVQELRDRGYSVNSEFLDYNIELQPKTIEIKIRANLEYSKGDESYSFNNFDTYIASPIYDILMVVRRIINDEATDFYFKYDEYMLMYPDFRIIRISFDDSRIYKVIERVSAKEFKFAIKGYYIPGRYM